MASIQRRPDRRKPWRARYWGPDGRQHSRSFARRADAQRWLAEVESAKVKGTWTDPALGRVRFVDWFAEWQQTTTNLRPTTEVRDAMLFRRYVVSRFGPMPLARIEQREVRAWVAELANSGRAPSTVRKCYQLLSKVMAAAVDAGMLGQSPCRRISLPRVERQEMRFLTPAEVARLAEAVGQGYRALVLLGAYGGLRIGEMVGLRRQAVDLDRGTVRVVEVITEMHGRLYAGPPKTEASRRQVGLPRFVVDELARHLGASGKPQDLVFANSQGRPLRTASFRSRVWRPATRAVGLDGVRIHDLRHTAVALWIAAGASPKEVAARAGHTSVSFTLDRYGHLYPESDRALRDRLDALHRGADGAR